MKNILGKIFLTGLVSGLTLSMALPASATVEDVITNKEQVEEKVNSISLNSNVFDSALVIVMKDEIEHISVKDNTITLNAKLKERGLDIANFTDEDGGILPPKRLFKDKEVFVIYGNSISGNSELISIPYETEEEVDPIYYVGEKFKKIDGVNGSVLKTTIVNSKKDSTGKNDVFSETSHSNFNVLSKPVNELYKIGARECDTKFSCAIVDGSQKRLKSDLGHPLGKEHIWTTYSTAHAGSHNFGAIDFPAASGTPIYAVADGIVTQSGYESGGGGNMAVVLHDDGNSSGYAHMVASPVVNVGDKVSKGQLLGHVGSTGNSTGPHLHFEIRNQTKEWGDWIAVSSYYDAYGVSLGECVDGPCMNNVN